MGYILFDRLGNEVNRISASKEFILSYANEMGYTYKEISTESFSPRKAPTNEMLSAQIQATLDRQEFLEDCIAEMATLLYS